MRTMLPRLAVGALVAIVLATLLVVAGSPQAEEDSQAAVASSTVVAPVTFYDDVLPILETRCQACHRPGEVAPMSLLTYSDARRFSRMIKPAIEARIMPPWPADNSVGVRFHNERALTQAEIDTLVAWVDAGAPEGEGSRSANPPEFVDGWQTDPSVVFQAPPFEIPPTGTVEYSYYIFPEKFEEDRWISMSEMRPSNRGVTHHLIAYVRPPGSSYFRDYPVGEYFVPEPSDRAPVEGETGHRWRQSIGGYAPGSNPGEANFPADQAVFLEAGSQMVWEVHYNTMGEATTDEPKLGLTFLDGEPKTRRMGTVVVDQGFEIPANADHHVVDAKTEILQDVTLLAMLPHMHLRGKAFEYRAVFPDGRTEILLSVPKYDFNWQLNYFLEEPMLLPAGTIIEGTAVYDNSSNNPHNPDPSQPVRWGDQSWEEMMVGFFTISFDPRLDPEKVFRIIPRDEVAEQ